MTTDSSESFRKSKSNPFSKNGFIGKAFRTDGAILQAAERVPLANNIVQMKHSFHGKTEALERAQKRNPCGHDGNLTKVAEKIPGVADGIRYIHKRNGHELEAERARAFSLKRLAGSQGAIVKVAALLPGTNLLAALALEAKGDTVEALEALNIIQQWRGIGKSDGALAKVAELFPGLDLVAFGLHLNGGQYAAALRAICKTRWIQIKSDSTVLVLSTGSVNSCNVLDIQSDLDVQPKASTLSGALLDMIIALLDFDANGANRSNIDISEDVILVPNVPQAGTQDIKINTANKYLKSSIDQLTARIPEILEDAVKNGNYSIHSRNGRNKRTRRQRRILQIVHFCIPPFEYEKPPSTSPGARVARVLQDSLPHVSVSHEPMPLNPNSFSIEPRKRQEALPIPEASVLACFSFIGCLGLGVHTGPLACASGCIAAGTYLHRTVKRNMIPFLNKFNSSSWKAMSEPVSPLKCTEFIHQQDVSNDTPTQNLNPSIARKLFTRKRTVSSQRSNKSLSIFLKTLFRSTSQRSQRSMTSLHSQENGGPCSVVLDAPAELVERLCIAELVREYLLDDMLSKRKLLNWTYPSFWLLHFFESCLRKFLNSALDGQTVPIGIPIYVPEGWQPRSKTYLPEIRLMLILWCQFTDNRYVTRVQVALVDGMVDEIVNVGKHSWVPKDLRDVDSRLAGFTDPVHLTFDIATSWSRRDQVNITLKNVSVKLSLPD